MKWLETNFKKLPSHAIDVVKGQYARAFILRDCRVGHVVPEVVLGDEIKYDVNRWLPSPAAIVGLVATTVSISPSERPIQIPVGDKFGWRRTIPPPLRDIDELHKVDFQGKNDEDPKEIHKDYIDV
ncbi:hypothetical protein J1N35_014802 [Gossypium stocksii]|uniref:Uncharacterized protein n=1 Tax=Gossypium stocksii TaxID=47602 RepID=A0A9D4AA42_9ROSI|nr:hypothetical protein J1N35_014802 [Gossypium stocksii]